MRRDAVTVSVIDGQAIGRVIELAHDLMHEQPGAVDCDPRPLLYAATAVNELRAIFDYVPEGDRVARFIARVAGAMNLASTVEIEQIIRELGDVLPEEIKKQTDQTVH